MEQWVYCLCNFIVIAYCCIVLLSFIGILFYYHCLLSYCSVIIIVKLFCCHLGVLSLLSYCLLSFIVILFCCLLLFVLSLSGLRSLLGMTSIMKSFALGNTNNDHYIWVRDLFGQRNVLLHLIL